MTVTHYTSSKGPIPIASMPYPYLKNAAEKLRREGRDADILAVMDERLAELNALDPEERPAPPGHNKPPAELHAEIEMRVVDPLTFGEIQTHIDDLYMEAKNWLDGAPISTAAQADEVSRLAAMIREAQSAADELRKRENEPFDTGKAEVQARYAPLISDTKAVRGKTVVAFEACQAALKPWLLRLDAEHAKEVERRRLEAEAAIEAAQVAAQVADPARLDDAEEVEALVHDARFAVRDLGAVEKGRVRVGGGEFRSSILKDNWVAFITDADEALVHYWKMQRGALEAALLDLAKQDVKAGKRSIPGFEVINDKKVG